MLPFSEGELENLDWSQNGLPLKSFHWWCCAAPVVEGTVQCSVAHFQSLVAPVLCHPVGSGKAIPRQMQNCLLVVAPLPALTHARECRTRFALRWRTFPRQAHSATKAPSQGSYFHRPAIQWLWTGSANIIWKLVENTETLTPELLSQNLYFNKISMHFKM